MWEYEWSRDWEKLRFLNFWLFNFNFLTWMKRIIWIHTSLPITLFILFNCIHWQNKPISYRFCFPIFWTFLHNSKILSIVISKALLSADIDADRITSFSIEKSRWWWFHDCISSFNILKVLSLDFHEFPDFFISH